MSDKPSRLSCHICANGNDLSWLDGGVCGACGRPETPLSIPAPVEQPDPIRDAVRKARGGDAPIQIRTI